MNPEARTNAPGVSAVYSGIETECRLNVRSRDWIVTMNYIIILWNSLAKGLMGELLIP